MTERLLDLPVKIFADGADLQGIAELSRQPYIHGLTTNPTLMRKVGLTDYESFAKAVLKEVKSNRSRLKFSPTILQRCAGKHSKSTSGRTTFTLRSQSQTPVANLLFR